MAKTKLNIFLAKEGFEIQDLIRELVPEPHSVAVGNGMFYYKENQEAKPKWLNNFFDNELDEIDLTNKTIQAAYLIKVNVDENVSRVFAMTFGLGRNVLRLDRFEERFGFITTLNLLNKEKIRSLDTQTVSNNPKNSRVMLGKTTSLTDFEIDVESDMLKSINGKVTEASLGDCVSATGRQSLSISITSNYHAVEDILPELYELFQSDSYRQKFPGIDNAREVKDKDIISQLNSQLIQDLKEVWESKVETVVLSIPDFIEDIYDSIRFRYGVPKDLYDELEMGDLLNYLTGGEEWDDISVQRKLENDYLRIIDDSGNLKRSWKLYNCLIDDCRLNDHQYVLNDGKWYLFDQRYADQINEFYDDIPISEIELPNCIKEKEGEYNKRVCEAEGKILFDAKVINPFNQTSFEVCDVFDVASKAFIHIKKNTGSSNLSHLVLQGHNSGEMLMQKEARIAAREKKPEIIDHLSEINFNANEYKIIYGIIEKGNDDNDRPNIPFFSKVSFRHAIRHLQNYGYTVELKSIKWE